MTTTPRIPSPSRLLAACTVTVMALTGCSGPADTTGDQSPAAAPSASPSPPPTWADGAHVAWDLDLAQAPTVGSGLGQTWSVGDAENNHPVVVQDTDEQVIIAAGNHISAYDPTTGQSTWSTTVTPAGKRAACAGGVVKERLWCISGVIDTATGEVALTAPVTEEHEKTSFYSTKNVAIRVESDGAAGPYYYTAFDPQAGTEMWSLESTNWMEVSPASDFLIMNGQVLDATTGQAVATLELPALEGMETLVSIDPLPDGTFGVVLTNFNPWEAAISGVVATVLDSNGQPMTPLSVTTELISLSDCGSAEAAQAVVASPADTFCFSGPGGPAVTDQTTDAAKDIIAKLGRFRIVAYDKDQDVAVYFTYFSEENGNTAALVSHEGYSTVDLSAWEDTDYEALQGLPELWRSEEMQTASKSDDAAPTGTSPLVPLDRHGHEVDHFYTVTYSAETMIIQRWEPGAES